MSYQLRPYEAKDKEGVIKLILPIQQEEFGVAITVKDQPDLDNISTYYQQGGGNFWVAANGDEIIGSIALIDIGNEQGVIRKMFVKAEYRGAAHGIAQQLVNELMAWCAAKQIEEIYLGTVDKMKAAHRFYEKNGFHSIEAVVLPKAFPIMKVDNRFFKRIIRSPKRIFHITTFAYLTTISEEDYFAPSLEIEGFIHCSTPDQIEGSLQRYFQNQEQLALLHIEPTRLTAVLKFEESNGKMFPHVYGKINKAAIVRIEALQP
jgi:uncharacterized protein (DUF952 family)/N-acetylglutamate synthase-like GNAT family acetyltransferase